MLPTLNPLDTERSIGWEDFSTGRCPACGTQELVKADVATSFGFRRRKGARCLACGHRFPVNDAVFSGLRQPALGEPHETYMDRYRYMLASQMRGLHVVVCLCGLLFGLALGGALVARFDEPLAMVVFFPITCLAWWVGRWLWPRPERIPGKCARCRYDLRGLTDNRCPECGTPFAGDTSSVLDVGNRSERDDN